MLFEILAADSDGTLGVHASFLYARQERVSLKQVCQRTYRRKTKRHASSLGMRPAAWSSEEHLVHVATIFHTSARRVPLRNSLDGS